MSLRDFFSTFAPMKFQSLIFFFLLICSAACGQKRALVSVSVIDMKEKPDYESATVSQAILGTPVEVDAREGYWNHITTPEGYQGWVTDMNIAPLSEKEFSEWKKAERVILTDYFSLFYEKPDFDSQVIGDGVMGGIVETEAAEFEKNSIFLKVKLPDGRVGYIEKRDIEPLDQWISSREATPENIASTAKQFLGFPYLWGGLSTKGFDCSGLVKLTYFMNGIILLRDASQQVKTGKDIDFKDILTSLEKGDLLYFGTKTASNPNPRISHVGIYLENGKFIHSSLMVKVNSLLPGEDDSYKSKSLIRVRRMLGCEDTEAGIVSIKNHPWYFAGAKVK